MNGYIFPFLIDFKNNRNSKNSEERDIYDENYNREEEDEINEENIFENSIFENRLYDIFLKNFELEIDIGIGAILSVGSEAENKLISFAARKGIDVENIKMMGRLGFNESNNSWEYHRSMNINAHDDNWRRFGSADDGRGYFILTSKKFIVLLKTTDEKVRNVTMCDFLTNIEGLKMGKKVLNILKSIVRKAIERSKKIENLEERNKFVIDVFRNEGLTKEFLMEYNLLLKNMIKDLLDK